MESLDEKVRRVLRDPVALVDYDPRWPALFEQEKAHLRACLPEELVGRIEHLGSTAVPGLAAKPVVDMLVEVRNLQEARNVVPPIMEPQGYDCFWRPSFGDDVGPWYVWLIKRDPAGRRTHHIHMVEAHFDHWKRLLFRDYLIAHPEAAEEYAALKRRLAAEHPDDRRAYTEGKTAFIVEVMEKLEAENPKESDRWRN